MANNLHTQTKAITTLFLVIGLVCIAYCALFSTLESIIIVALLPLIGYTFICAFRNPVTAIYVLFILNYFLIAWMRYTETTGRSVCQDGLSSFQGIYPKGTPAHSLTCKIGRASCRERV